MAARPGLAVGVRNAVFDIYQNVLPREVPSGDFPVHIIEIDQDSLEKVGPWPWPRTVLAALAGELLNQGASVVGFDLLFPEPDRYRADNLVKVYPRLSGELKAQLLKLPNPDKALEDVLRQPGSYVALGRAGVVDGRDRPSDVAAAFIVQAEFSGDRPVKLLSFNSAIANIPELDHVAAGQGLLNGPPDRDGIVRHMPIVAEVAGQLMPSLALEVIRLGIAKQRRLDNAQSAAPEIVLHAPNGRLHAVKLGRFTIPVQIDGRLALHFTEPLSVRTSSALAVLNGTMDFSKIRGKLVILGPAAVGLEDNVATPLAARSYGVDLHAQVIEAIYHQSWLVQPRWGRVLEWSMAVVLGMMAVLALPLLPPRHAVAVTLFGAAVVLGASMAAFAGAKILFDATLPLLGAGVPAAVTLAAILLETEQRRRVLQASVIERRVEVAAAGRIQSGMLPDPASLKALPKAIDLWPVLEPADAIGGDLYDVFMLDENRLYFVVGDVTGKGMPAALFMSVAKALTKSIMLREGARLSTAIGDANREISRDNPNEMFVTALLGVLDVTSGEASLCNAGHENPIIMRADGSVGEFAMEGGLPLCAFDGYVYPVETVTLQPGDRLVIISDGVSEAMAPDRTLFGRERIAKALRKGSGNETSQQTVTRLITAVRSFEAGEPPSDDLTVMAIGYRGEGATPPNAQ